MGRNLADEEGEAMAALLGPQGRGRATAAGGSAGTTALRPGTATAAAPREAVRAARDAASPPVAAPAWLPWAALIGGGAIGAGCILGGMALSGLLAASWWPEGTDAAWRVDLLFNVVIFLPMLLLALLAGRATRVGVLEAGARPGAMIGLGAAMGLSGVAAATAYAAFAGVAQRGTAEGGGLLLLLGSLAMLLQSGTEELLLRGWMQPAIARRWGGWAAIALTALTFAGLHVLGGARSPIELLNLALGGVLFGLLRWKTGGIVAPVAAHFAWNWSEGLLFGLDPNPGVSSFGALLDLDLVGPAIWGGSDQGLNGSLAMLLVLAALVVPLAMWRGEGRPG